MKQLLVLMLLLPSLVMAKPANIFYDSKDLLQALLGPTAEALKARGYIMGIMDAGDQTIHCAPETVSENQVVDTVLNRFMRFDLPLNAPAYQQINYTLQTTWPCTH